MYSLLNGDNDYTVFAPANWNGNSTALLNYTIVPGTFVADSLADGQVLTTLSVSQGSLNNQGQVVKVSKNGATVSVQGVQVAQSNVGVGFTSNGVIHFLAGDLPLPGNALDVTNQNADLTTFDSALVLAGLASTLTTAGAFTVFAPTNAAFNRLPASLWGYLSSNYSQLSNDALAHVLKNHAYSTYTHIFISLSLSLSLSLYLLHTSHINNS